MEMLVERLIGIALFAGQALIIVIAIMVILGFIFSLAQKNKQKEELEIEDLNQRYKNFGLALKAEGLTKKQAKALKKTEKKQKKKNDHPPSHIFVVDFDGDLKAQAVDQLREEVTAILSTCSSKDEILIRLESPGGVVHGYGLAAAQLQRIVQHKIKLTVCVDKVAASGGYMMACVADQIIAAPFAIVGSIGVLAQVPNFHRLLKKHDIDYREITAGEYKRTMSLLGEITEKGEEKFTEQITDTHHLFKNFVKDNREKTQIDKVATGEYWYGTQAKELGLVDEIMTSDEYLLQKSSDHKILRVSLERKKKLSEKLGLSLGKAVVYVLERIWYRLETSSYR